MGNIVKFDLTRIGTLATHKEHKELTEKITKLEEQLLHLDTEVTMLMAKKAKLVEEKYALTKERDRIEQKIVEQLLPLHD